MLLHCGLSSHIWCSIFRKLCKIPAAISHVRLHSYYIVSLPVLGVVVLVASCCFGLFPLPGVVVVSVSLIRRFSAINEMFVMLLTKYWVNVINNLLLNIHNHGGGRGLGNIISFIATLLVILKGFSQKIK